MKRLGTLRGLRLFHFSLSPRIIYFTEAAEVKDPSDLNEVKKDNYLLTFLKLFLVEVGNAVRV